MSLPPRHSDERQDAGDVHRTLRKILDRIALKKTDEDRPTKRRADSAGVLVGAMGLARAALREPAVDRALLLGRGHEDRVIEAVRALDGELAPALVTLLEPAAEINETVNLLRPIVGLGKTEHLGLALRTALDWRHRSTGIDPDVLALMVGLLRPMTGEVLFDPDCGDGLLVSLAAVELSRPPDQRVRVEARASSEEQVALATVVGFLLDREPHVRLRDSARSTAQLSFDGDRARSVTSAYPRLISFLEEPDHSPRHSHWEQIGRAVPLLERGGRAVLLLPTRAPLSSKRDLAKRRLMLERNVIRAVIELPSARWSRSAHRGGAILVLEVGDPDQPPVSTTFARFVSPDQNDDEPASLGPEVIEELLRAIQTPGAPSDAVLIEHVHLRKLLLDDNLDPAHRVRIGEPPSLERAMTALEVAENEEREAAGEAQAALQRYLAR
jgi:hypothetical protein